MDKLMLLRLLPRNLRDAVVRRVFRLDEAAIEELEVAVARTPQEHHEAARLLQQMYERRGIVGPHPSGIRATPHLLAPSTAVFVAKHGRRVVGTMSLVLDSPLGLPMDKIYGPELAPLRAAGRRLAEVGALCLAAGHRHSGGMYLLCRIMHDFARMAGCDDLVIAVHPDVEDYYRANMLFETIGPVRSYPGLERSALSLAMRLDERTFLDRLVAAFGWDDHDASNPFWLWFGRESPQIEAFDRSELGVKRHLANRRKAAERLASLRPDVLDGLTASEREYLAAVVPALGSALVPAAISKTRARSLDGRSQ